MKIVRTVGVLLLTTTPCLAQNVFDPMALPSRPSGVEPPPYFGARFKQALRHQIEAIELGQPDYDAMTPRTANQLRGQFAGIHPAPAQQWGALVSLKYRSSMSGMEVYEARFEKVRVQWVIAQNRKGKITGIAFKTLS